MESILTIRNLQILALIERLGMPSGSDIRSAFDKLTGTKLPTGTLYNRLQKFRIEGMVKVTESVEFVADQRRKKYSITKQGMITLSLGRVYFLNVSRFAK